MNIHFTDKKVLHFDKNKNLKDDNEKFSPLVVYMGSCDGFADNVVDIIKDFVNRIESSKYEKYPKNDVYIYDKSTEKDFWYCIV